MAGTAPLTAFQAIQNKIKTLCLQDFPCGTGSWHKDHSLKKICKKSGSQVKDRYENLQLDIVEKDKKNIDQLVDLIVDPRSPWYMDYSWSQEARRLKKTAIKSPWLIKSDFVYSYFRTLNIDDESVTEIDEGLLRFKNLEEITLSANYIKTVNSSCLPASLKVLELCANDIDEITGLCNKPPPLHHLGLGRNRISSVGNCISGTLWPDLVSLDLSYNNLCGLTEMVKTLSTLPKLRNLNLQGNPVSLIAGYRGYVIDTLRNLTVLDDKQISANEKYSFNGLATLEESVRDEAIVQLGVISLKGLHCPPEIMNPQSQPDYPVKERTYFVQFVLPRVFSETVEKTDPQSQLPLTGMHSAELTSLAEIFNTVLGEASFSPVQPPDNVEHTQLERNQLEQTASKEKFESVTDVCEKTETPADVTQTVETEGKPQTVLEPINSSFLPWEDHIQFHWTRDVHLTDLLTLRDFFRTGMDVHVMEQTIEAYPPWVIIGVDKKMDTKAEIQKEKKKNKEPEKPKEKVKKKAESAVELIKCPPTFQHIASFHVPLEAFLNGEHEYKNTFTKINLSSQTLIPRKISEEKIVEKKMDKSNALFKSPSLKKDRAKTPLAKEEKTPGKRKHGYGSEDMPLSTELQLTITVKLGQWMTAQEAVTVMKTASLEGVVIVPTT